jgi:hypothetical protein
VLYGKNVDEVITSFKVCIMRIDQIMEDIDDNNDWFLREILMQYRQSLHKGIDSLLSIKKKLTTVRYPSEK